ncbi:hypothetical protein CEQ90_12930 [Lewinellaceae bacterium SD302]|nr:hypothetical protein CEQ90_12930 [Lewinellaceae bacterium SD302]
MILPAREGYFDNTNPQLVGLTNTGSKFMFASRFRLGEYSPEIDTIRPLPLFNGFITGDVTYLNGHYFGISLNFNTGQNQVIKIDSISGQILDTIFQDDFLIADLKVDFLPGISTAEDDDCSGGSYLIQPFRLLDTSENADPFPDFAPFGVVIIDPESGTHEIRCLQEHQVTNAQAGFYDAASLDIHRQTCEVRLDLDADNRAGRVGPHFQSFLMCADRFPLADEDVEIWTVDDRPIDSMTVIIKDDGPLGSAAPSLHYPGTEGFTVVNQADTLLRVYPNDPSVAGNYAAWTAFIQQVELEIPLPRPEGYRVTEIFLHADGLTSDRARSYLYGRPDFFPTGRDITIYVCRNNTALPFSALPDAFPGGRWEPELGTNFQDDPFFDNTVHPFGTYHYITDFENCQPDTAIVRILPRPEPELAFPNQNDTVYICAGESYVFDPASRPNTVFYFYNDFFPESYREISEPVTVQAFVSYLDATTGGDIIPCQETISLTVLDTTATALTRNLDTTICAGDSLYLAGFSFFEAGQFTFTAGGNGCDTLYDLTLSLQEEESAEVSFTLCPGDSLLFGGQVYLTPGSYELASAGPGCDTLYQIEILPAEVPAVNLDTSICVGQILEISGEAFSEAGSYFFSVPAAGGAGCDTAYSLQLTVRPLVQFDADTILQEGQTFQAPGILVSAPIDTVYQWPGQNGDCDTIVKLVVDYVSSTHVPGSAITQGYRIQNPLRAGERFRLWQINENGTPQPIGWQDLQLFSARGHSTGIISSDRERIVNDLPVGLYYYRLRTVNSSSWVSGKVLLVR